MIKKNSKIYIACPISKYLREGFDKEFVEVINKIDELCCKYSNNVFISLKKQEFGQNNNKIGGQARTIIDYNEVKSSDYLIAIPEDSMGVSVELGWASAMQRDILVFIDEKYQQSNLVKYITAITSGEKALINTNNGYLSQYSIIEKAIIEFLEKK